MPVPFFVSLALAALATFSPVTAYAFPAMQDDRPPVSPAVAGQWEGEAQRAESWPIFLLLHLDAAGGGSGTLFVLGQTLKFDSIGIDGDRFTAALGTGADGLELSGRIEVRRLSIPTHSRPLT